MAGQNQVSVCNLALAQIGARATISALNEGSTEANNCSLLFSFVFQQLARTAPFNCLRQQKALTLIGAAQGTEENPDGTSLPLPAQPWQYMYLIPSDCLFVRYILPPNIPSNVSLPSTAFQAAPTIYGAGQVPYVVAYYSDPSGNPFNVILTDCVQAQAVYTVDQQNPQIWDSLFTSAFVAALATYLVPALSLNLSLMKITIGTANQIISQARASDGNELPVSQNREASWIAARNDGTGYWGSTWWGWSWQDMAFPGGW